MIVVVRRSRDSAEFRFQETLQVLPVVPDKPQTS